MDQTNSLRILITDDDKTGRDISKMSNFFDGYIDELSLQLSAQMSDEAVFDLQIGDIGIINEVLQHAEGVMAGKYSYLPDFDSLPLDIRTKLKKGIYSIAESRQVEGNMRAVILDEKGVRIKDITLKKVLNTPETFEATRSIINQMQLRKINAKLGIIQELQSYQIERERDQNLIVPFLNARDYILRAQVVGTLKEQQTYLGKASDELTQAINSVYSDMQTSSKWLDRLTAFPIFQLTPIIQRQITYLTQDLQLATKYVGLQMQVLDHLGNEDNAMLELNKFRRVLKDFTSLPLGRRKKPAVMLMQEYSLYDTNTQDLWLKFAHDTKPFIQLESSLPESIYLITAKDVEDENGKASNKEM